MPGYRRIFSVLVLWLTVLTLGLGGCDRTPSHDKAKTQSAAADTEATAKAPPNIPFKVLEIGERSFDNAPALAVLFSHPMAAERRYDEFLHVSDALGAVKGAWVLGKNQRMLYFPHAKPQTRYTVTVDAGLDSAAGVRLTRSRSKTFTTRKITPVVSFLSQGLLLPRDLSDGLPVVTINVPEVDIEFFRLKPSAVHRYGDWMNNSGNSSYYELRRLQGMAKLVYSGRFELNPPPDARTVSHIPVRDIAALGEPGMYLAVMRRPGHYDYRYKTAYFFVSDIGVQARLYKDRAVIVTASLKTGKPLADVRIRVQDRHGRDVASGRTDAHGELRLDQSLRGSALLMAQHGRDVSFLPLRGPALDMSAFDLGKRPYRSQEIFAYSPRDIYRSGETLTVSALLRDHDGRMLPAQPLQARLIRPDHREARRFTWQPEALAGVAYYQTRLPLSDNAPTGQWQLELRSDPGSRAPDHVFKFQVQDFVPERMKLALQAPDAPLQSGDPLVVQVQADYLYGAPAAGNRLEGTLLVRSAGELLKNRPGFVFGDTTAGARSDRSNLAPVKLDAKGHATVEIPPRWRDSRNPLQLLYTASVFESGGRPVTRSISRQVWPADALVGVRPLTGGKRYFENGRVQFDLIKAAADGSLLAAKGLQVKLIREDRDYYWAYSEQQGWHYAYSQSNYPVSEQSVDLTAGTPGKITFTLDYGHYLLAVLDPDTGLTTRTEFRVGWWSWQQGSGTTRPDQVTLRLDKPAYDPGDTAKLTLVPPHDGQAVVMVEDGNGLLWSKQLPVSAKGSSVDIPVSADWNRHDLYVSAVVFRPGSAADKITPNRAVGLLPLRLNRAARHLKVTLDTPDVVEPLKPVDVNLSVAGAGKGPVYVTLATVDVGILSLTDFLTPDPFKAFFGQRRYSVDTYDLYGKVIELSGGPKARIRFGGDADVANAGQRARSRLQFVTLFSGPVKLDAEGHATIPLDMPDFNGRVRLMAVAFSGSRFGSGEREMTVRSPLVTQLSMPRFLAGGDHSEFTLDLANLSGRAQHLTLTLSAKAPLTLSDGERSLDLADGEKKTLRFPVTAADAFATAGITLRVKGDGLQLTRHWKLDVRPAYPGETRRMNAVIDPHGSFAVDKALLDGLSPGTVQAYVNISAIPPLDLAKNLHDLLHYPYGCLEQTVSSTYPWLFATPEMVKRFSLNALRAADREQSVEKGIRRLADKQLPSGGFGLWTNHSPEEPWLTPYAVNFLLDARDRGFAVPDDMLGKALRRLQQYLQRGVSLSLVEQYRQHRNYARFASTAYAAYLLARVNRAPLGTLRTLYERRSSNSDAGLPLLQLGLALHLAGDRQLGDKAMREGLELIGHKRDSYYYGDYGSTVRDLALAIHLLYANRVDLPGRDRLVFELADALQQRQWLSTQERNALFMAGVSLAQADAGSEFTGSLAYGDRTRAVAATRRLVLRPSLAELQAGMRFTSDSGKPLYVRVAVGGYPEHVPAPVDGHMHITRTYYTADGKPLAGRPVKAGELLLVYVQIGADRYVPDALVEDLLPAGLEPETQGLAHTVKLDQLSLDGTPVSKLAPNRDVVHEEYRDDRYTAAVSVSSWRDTRLLYLVRAVTPGTYRLPAPQVESMYRPENRAIGATQETLTVLP
jgi:alpha-2-macroglobulin